MVADPLPAAAGHRLAAAGARLLGRVAALRAWATGRPARGPDGQYGAAPGFGVPAVELAGGELVRVVIGGRAVDVTVDGIGPFPPDPGKVVIDYRDGSGVPGAVVVPRRALIPLRAGTAVRPGERPA